jgi:hypothetical protein
VPIRGDNGQQEKSAAGAAGTRRIVFPLPAELRMTKSDGSGPPPAERRPKPRSRVLLSGLIVYGDGAYSFDCSFRNLSETGARVMVGKNHQFPSEFFLINVRDRVAYDCRIVWNKGGEVGVAFKATIALSAVTDPRLAYLKKLWLAKAAS